MSQKGIIMYMMLTSNIGLLRPAQITLGNEDVSHRQHTKAAKFLILGTTQLAFLHKIQQGGEPALGV
jgi:hypothetical protein